MKVHGAAWRLLLTALYLGVAAQGIAALVSRRRDLVVQPVRVGEAFPLPLLAADGGPYGIPPCAVLILSSPNCTACKVLATLTAEAVRGGKAEHIVWISLSEPTATLKFAHDYSLPTTMIAQIANYSTVARRLHRLGTAGTPAILLVDRDANVRQITYGADPTILTARQAGCVRL